MPQETRQLVENTLYRPWLDRLGRGAVLFAALLLATSLVSLTGLAAYRAGPGHDVAALAAAAGALGGFAIVVWLVAQLRRALRQADERLAQQQREAVHQASRLSALAEIAATLAHEINQPLTVITTYTDACQRLLQSPPVDHEEIITVLGRCHAQALRAASIIERLREFIRQRRHQPAPWPVVALFDEALDVCRAQLDEARISVDSRQLAGDLLVVGDRILLVQLLVNLIRNAIDAMRAAPESERQLTLTAAPDAAAAEVVISVADRGCGLPTADSEALFAPFFSTKGEGLGLGLAICRSLAESHNGRLWASDNAGGGAVFHLAIPAEAGSA
ncbi:MAG: ATP-binding protein [Betaproteobacteria bacterium]|nr:ATP-binding protein [Betaproteobacteria bacterium]MCL2885380.1 ATP-binding protein [Betaproteobacteria bacterium]